MSFYVYILYSLSKDKYYIGSCENVDIRLIRHNSGRNHSTKSGIPWELKKIEVYNLRREAYQREVFIKRMKSRKFIEQVIAGER